MKKILQKVICNIAIPAITLFSQQAKAQLTFQKLVGYYAYDAHKVVNGTGYVFGGISSILWPPAQRNSYVVRTDINGDTLWTSCWGGTIGSCDQQYINDLCPLSDGGVIANGGKGICGDTTKGGTIARLDANGNVLWAKSFSIFCDPYPCIQSNDGNFVSGGYIVTSGLGPNSPLDAYLTKLDSATGDTIWSKRYGGAGNDDWFYHILQTADGGYLAAGKTNSFGQGGLDIYLVKTDANGNLQWSKTYGTSSLDETAFGHCLQPTSDGGYILTGSSSGTQGVFLLKLDASGNISWAKYYDGQYAHAVKQTLDGGYVMAGTMSGDVLLIKTDGSGNISWSKAYGGSGSEQGLILELASDGGYITGGSSKTWGQTLYVVKTDSNGNSGCNETNPVITNSVAPFIMANVATQVSVGANTISYSYLFARGATVTSLCTTMGVKQVTSIANQVSVYPNPSNENVTIQSETEIGVTIIYNSLGEIIYKEKINFTQHQIDLSKQAAGIYFLQAQNKQIKLIKE